MSDEDTPLARARAAKRRAIALYGDLELVGGIGISRVDGKYAIKISLLEALNEEGLHENERTLKSEIDGVPIVVNVVGKVKKQDSSE